MNSYPPVSIRPAHPAADRASDGLYAVFGNPLAQSLSPRMQGAAFAAMGIDARYSACQTDDAAAAVRLFRERGLSGASVTIPFKETIMPLLDEVDPDARKIGAVNTIVRRGGLLVGYNTDGPGLVRDLVEWMGDLSGKSFVVLGAGGAARAALFSIARAGGTPIVVNRSQGRAEALAREFGCDFVPLAEIGRLRADCLINSTPLGMVPAVERTPLPRTELAHFSRVMDMVYNPIKTRLLREAKAAGCAVRSGVGMFAHQGAEQFRLWTGLEPPRDIMRRAVLEGLGEDDAD
ncbi:MAG: shikimate dehydrogenase [Deltaproteobacteria bacterium]|nr:shikimate dehydrogenase [Deltaproteobacteria bacterium]